MMSRIFAKGKWIVRQIALIPAVVVLLVFRILRPIVDIRLVIVGFHRFGHLALEPEMYLSRHTEQVDRRVIELWSVGKPSNQTNRFLASLWKRTVRCLPSWQVDSLVRGGDLVPALACSRPQLSIHGPDNGLDRTSPKLSLTKSEVMEGHRRLEQIGVDPTLPYVCLVVRDSSHYISVGQSESPGYSVLNFDVETFHPVARALASAGYQVIRMGAGSERNFGLSHDRVIDYAKSSLRSEFLDVYIAATCSFALSTQTGPDAVCLAFRRPVNYVDVTRFSQFFFGTRLATWNPSIMLVDGRRLSLRELVQHEIFWLEDPDAILRSGVIIERSSPEFLAEMAIGYAQSLLEGSQGGSTLSPHNREAQEILREGMGERGREIFGSPHALLNPVFLQCHADWFLA